MNIIKYSNKKMKLVKVGDRYINPKYVKIVSSIYAENGSSLRFNITIEGERNPIVYITPYTDRAESVKDCRNRVIKEINESLSSES